MKVIGLDPGTVTGFAEWDARNGELLEVLGLSVFDAQARLRGHRVNGEVRDLLVIFEDARNHRISFGRNAKRGRAVLQGVGSIKRDCGLWEEFLMGEGIPFVTVKPRRRATKKDADLFKRITGWPGRTNEHGRDAAMFVYGLREPMADAMIREWQGRQQLKNQGGRSHGQSNVRAAARAVDSVAAIPPRVSRRS
jgi:hypothetical protein